MKNLHLSLFLFLVIGIISFSHAQENTFSKVYDNNPSSNGIQVSGLQLTYDSAYMIVGESEYDGLLIKADTNGEISSHKIFKNTGVSKKLRFKGVTPTIDSGFVLAGYTRNNSSGFLDAFYTKINSNGDTIWTKSNAFFGNHLYVMSISQTLDTGYIMCGYTYNGSSPYHKNYIAKVDAFGNFEWSSIITIGNSTNISYTVKQASDGTYFLGGYFSNSNPYEPYAFLLNISTEGELLWSKKYQASNPQISCRVNDLLEAYDGFFVYLTVGNDVSIMRIDYSGNIIWNKSYITGDEDYMLDISSNKLRKTSDHSLVFAHGSVWGWGGITKIDTLGNLLMSNELFLEAQDVLETAKHDFFIVGNGPMQGVKKAKGYLQIGIIQVDFEGNGAACVYGSYDYSTEGSIVAEDVFVDMEFGGEPSLIPIEISTSELLVKEGCVDFYGGIEEDYEIKNLQISPNPNNGIFTINLNKNIKGKLIITNAMGQFVSGVEIIQMQSIIDLRNTPKGVYFYHFISSDKIISKGKFIICK